MATLKDIAERAGVNIATVSRFFNNRNLVKAATAEKIEAIVKEVGYHQRARRQGPRTPDRVGIRHFRVMIVINSISPIEHSFHWGAVSGFIAAVFDELQKLDISMEFCVIGEDGTIPERLNSDYCDGAIICSEPENPDVRAKLHRRLQNISTVNAFLSTHPNDFDLVKFDYGEVARIIMRYFYERGVKEVAIFPNFLGAFSHQELHETFISECGRVGIQCRDVPAEKLDSVPMCEFYKQQAEAFLRLGAVTGMVFVTGADMLGVMNELRARGVDISRHEFISVFSSTHSLRYVEKLPPFIDLKHHQLGVLTARRLLERIHSFNRLPRTDIVIAPELVYLDNPGD